MLLRKDVKEHATRYYHMSIIDIRAIVRVANECWDSTSRVWLTKLHLALNVAAVVLVCCAGATVYWTKKAAGERHLNSPHAWAALATAMFLLLNIFQVPDPYAAIYNTLDHTNGSVYWTGTAADVRGP